MKPRETNARVAGKAISAGLARVFRRWELKFRGFTDQNQRQFADDVADLGRRLLREMAGVKTE